MLSFLRRASPSLGAPGVNTTQVVEEEVHRCVNVAFSKCGLSMSPNERAEVEAKMREILLQKILSPRGQRHLENSKKQEPSDDEVKKILGASYQAVVEKREKLRDKWLEMDDSEERRDLSGLLFSDMRLLSSLYLAILSDSMELFVSQWKPDDPSWRKLLDISCLAGSKNIAEFVINEKKDFLTDEDYGFFLGYISVSFEHDWAIDFAEKMKEKNMEMPEHVYTLCSDLDLINEIKSVFNPKNRLKK